MKSKSSTNIPLELVCRGATVAGLIGPVVLAVAFFAGAAAQGAALISKAPNTAVYIGLPFTNLEFENPLTGTESVVGHAVLEWRDADYSKPGHPLYDDWSVFTAGGVINGNVNEIYMRQAGQSVWTTNTVPGTIVSIHLNGDNNDGIAQVMVDGVEVARLDMFFLGGAGPCCETALIVVHGLSNTSHVVTVNDLGAGMGQGVDLHVMGAAVLRENPVKWDQPPDPTTVTNTFYYGWNQLSVANPPRGIAADDWVCNSTNPVTKIRWWGSFIGWGANVPPPVAPNAFQIQFWTDVPAGVGAPYSHPGGVVWQINCLNYTWQFVGYDYDPTTTNIEACFLFEYTLTPAEYFQQTTPAGTIYWLSIGAVYQIGTAGPWPWGWKTRERDPFSQAPDAAVITSTNMPPGWDPIFWPTPTNWWDLAFELISSTTGRSVKWEQVPDLSTNGMDVHATFNPGAPPPFLLADDFRCTHMGPITNITIWGSWTNDVDWFNTIFTLSIHDDIPTNISPTGYSMPGLIRWQMTFVPGQYVYSLYAGNINEWWFTPTNGWRFPGDHQCFQYDFNIMPLEAFWQEGTTNNPKVYWLDVQAQPQQAPPYVLFGWKTCPTNWNDDAVWVNSVEPYAGLWNRLVYPPPHPRHGQTVDMAFRLNAGTAEASEIKWSQPPIATADIPLPFFNGWNEVSWYGGEYQHPIVADDWVCTTTNPVTDIHWWGSFSNWNSSTPPAYVPDLFFISFWTDVPAGPLPGAFSHPDICYQMITGTSYSYQFVGWDWDPRNLAAGPEACFRFDLDLSTNDWFYQNPGLGTNIYWISIAAAYTNAGLVAYPWGWKSRPRDPASPAPDDAVLIYDPVAPLPGMNYMAGQPIWWPDPTNSWDMAFQLTTRWPDDLDFGDAPDPSYPTVLASNGARHYIVPGFNLGTLIDAETNGLPNWNATGDDTNKLADEDGVFFQPPLLVGTQAWVNVVLTSLAGTGRLDAWLDFNQNGAWDGWEKIFNNLALVSGTNNLNFPVPTNAPVGRTFARFRLSSAGGLLPGGAAGDGEVEDYMVALLQYRPTTNIVITNIVLTLTNCTVYWNAENNVHYWLMASTNLSEPAVNWTKIGSEVIGPVNNQTESARWPTNRFYRVVAPYVWP
jgi:hypothetical protein